MEANKLRGACLQTLCGFNLNSPAKLTLKAYGG